MYDFAHIGNFRAYVFADLLRRWLEYRGMKVFQVMNITDVDDKTIKGAQKESSTLKDFTQKYEKAFFEDRDALRIKPASQYCRATEHIAEMQALIKRLMANGFAYQTDDGVFFAISKFSKYGLLARIQPSPQEEQKGSTAFSRIAADEYEKTEAKDFALWKSWKPEDGDVKWDSAWGEGRPGWHIECSAMSMKYLGETFDLHTGGVDLVFPHHENEIAQSKCATGKDFVRIWMHNEHLMVEGRKMSKSLGNIITLRDLQKDGTKMEAVRYLLLSAQFRTQMNFTKRGLGDATKTLERLNEFANKMKWLREKKDESKKAKAKTNTALIKIVKSARAKFEKFMDANLDTPRALAALHGMMTKVNKALSDNKVDKKTAGAVWDFLTTFNEVFDVLDIAEDRLTDEEKEIVQEREKLRREKKFKEADLLREMLRKRGLLLEDTPQGVRWKRVRQGLGKV